MENKNRGWIKLHRKLTEKGFYKKSQYVHLWIHLLLKANHKKKEFMFNNRIIVIKEGQLITGRKQLAKETGINESMVERILKMLEIEQQIEQQTDTKYRVITIVNWVEHQSRGQQNEQQVNSKRTADEQQVNTNKNDKKLENENNGNNILTATATEGYQDLEHHLMACWGNNGRSGYIVIHELLELGKKHGKDELYEAIRISATAGKEKCNARYVKGILENNKPKPGTATNKPVQQDANLFIAFFCKCGEHSFSFRRSELERNILTSYTCPKCTNKTPVKDILAKAEASGINRADFIDYRVENDTKT
ncbi:MAG: hypothetical protein WC269_05820 [Candidatus Gracilibacteria bacterium]|jgi:DNA-binding transcriptional regulator YhcF (GntR family)/predicted RNA-binding Zn-ribbon protein involved in translation (DUF1610 family)